MKKLIAWYKRMREWSRAEHLAHLKAEVQRIEAEENKAKMARVEKMDYPALPPVQPGKVGYRVRDKSKTVILYQGKDGDVARLVLNSFKTNLVPAGETMEKMP